MYRLLLEHGMAAVPSLPPRPLSPSACRGSWRRSCCAPSGPQPALHINLYRPAVLLQVRSEQLLSSTAVCHL